MNRLEELAGLRFALLSLRCDGAGAEGVLLPSQGPAQRVQSKVVGCVTSRVAVIHADL